MILEPEGTPRTLRKTDDKKSASRCRPGRAAAAPRGSAADAGGPREHELFFCFRTHTLHSLGSNRGKGVAAMSWTGGTTSRPDRRGSRHAPKPQRQKAFAYSGLEDLTHPQLTHSFDLVDVFVSWDYRRKINSFEFIKAQAISSSRLRLVSVDLIFFKSFIPASISIDDGGRERIVQ